MDIKKINDQPIVKTRKEEISNFIEACVYIFNSDFKKKKKVPLSDVIFLVKKFDFLYPIADLVFKFHTGEIKTTWKHKEQLFDMLRIGYSLLPQCYDYTWQWLACVGFWNSPHILTPDSRAILKRAILSSPSSNEFRGIKFADQLQIIADLTQDDFDKYPYKTNSLAVKFGLDNLYHHNFHKQLKNSLLKNVKHTFLTLPHLINSYGKLSKLLQLNHLNYIYQSIVRVFEEASESDAKRLYKRYKYYVRVYKGDYGGMKKNAREAILCIDPAKHKGYAYLRMIYYSIVNGSITSYGFKAMTEDELKQYTTKNNLELCNY